MRKNLTILLCLAIFVGAFSQAPAKKKLLFVCKALNKTSDYPGNTDSIVFVKLKETYDVTLQLISKPSDTTGYDVAFFSEFIGSGDGWQIYSRANIPFVISKTWAVKKNAKALSWINEAKTDSSYGNTRAVYFTINTTQKTHPILNNLTLKGDSLGVMADSGYLKSGANTQFVCDMPGVTNIAYVKNNNPLFPGIKNNALVAINANTTLNGNKLKNRAVILGYAQAGYSYITDNGYKLLLNSLEWAMTGKVVSVKTTEKLSASVSPNPTNGIVEIQFEKTLKSIVATVVSVGGSEVLVQKANNTASMVIDLSSCNSGLYLIKFSGSEPVATQKIIVK